MAAEVEIQMPMLAIRGAAFAENVLECSGFGLGISRSFLSCLSLLVHCFGGNVALVGFGLVCKIWWC